MKLTYELLHSAGSYGGNGFNRPQLELLGVAWPPRKGWLRGLAGTEIDDAKWEKVLALSGVRKKQERIEILGEQTNPDIEAQVCADILERQQRGIAKYGVTVADNPLALKEWLQHAYEETLDKAIYLKRAIAELNLAK